jgi:hypothetical protein
MNCNAVTGLATTMNYPMGDLAVNGLFPVVVCFKTPNTGEMVMVRCQRRLRTPRYQIAGTQTQKAAAGVPTRAPGLP